jgi:hypothetical protein
MLVALIAGAAILSRAWLDYGADADAARGIESALHLARTGEYIPSRLPGYPAFEGALALIAPWGKHLATNLFVTLGYVLAVVAFSRLVRNRPRATLWTVLFALTPIVLVNAATSLDYLWGLAALLWCYVLLQRGNDMTAALLAAIAIGCRLPNGIFVAPAMVHVVLQRRSWGRAIVFGAIASGLGLLTYLPVFQRYGMAMFHMPASLYSLRGQIFAMGYNALNLFGPIATVGLALIIALAAVSACRHRLARRMPSTRTLFEVLVVLAFVLLFIWHPDESAYLLACVPFGYLLLSSLLTRRQTVVAGAFILSFAVVTIDMKGGESGRRSIGFRPTWGVLISDYEARNELRTLRTAFVTADLPEPAVVITGRTTPLTIDNPAVEPARWDDLAAGRLTTGRKNPRAIPYRVRGRDIYLVYELTREDCEVFRELGFKLYIFSTNAPSIAIHKYGYKPSDVGAEMLMTRGPRAFYRHKKG